MRSAAALRDGWTARHRGGTRRRADRRSAIEVARRRKPRSGVVEFFRQRNDRNRFRILSGVESGATGPRDRTFL